MDIKIYKKQIWYIIPIVSIFISIIYMFGHRNTPIPVHLLSIFLNIILTAGLWVGCMIIVNEFWKRFPWQIHPTKHLILEIIAILLYTNGYTAIFQYIILNYFYKEPISFTNAELAQNYISINLITLLITAIHEAVYFYKQWKEHFSKSAKLEKDNIQAKYETLKAQINPHFLFNSLNSLVALVDENPAAVGYIDNLSEFLRYMLKSRDRELVLVRSELEMLKNYINLQKTRFKKNLDVQINIDEKFFHYSLPPLVIQMLVENCIKHNIISADFPLTIRIFAQKESIFIENNLQIKTDIVSTGQGLKNIKDRYAFFTTREIKIIQTNQKYSIEVPLLFVEL